MNTNPIVIECVLNSSPLVVWNAITRKDEMRKWYFDLVEFKAEQGFQFQFSGGPSPERQYLHLCEVLEVLISQRLSYSWRYDGYPGSSTVIFDLIEKGDKTLVRLTHQGLETFPVENPDFAKSNFEIGWNSIITVSLKDFLKTL